MKNFFKWFNGKKTNIAALLLIVSAFLTEFVIGKWGETAEWIPKVIDVLNYLGMIFGSVGLGHKAYKSISAPKQ